MQQVLDWLSFRLERRGLEPQAAKLKSLAVKLAAAVPAERRATVAAEGFLAAPAEHRALLKAILGAWEQDFPDETVEALIERVRAVTDPAAVVQQLLPTHPELARYQAIKPKFIPEPEEIEKHKNQLLGQQQRLQEAIKEYEAETGKPALENNFPTSAFRNWAYRLNKYNLALNLIAPEEFNRVQVDWQIPPEVYQQGEQKLLAAYRKIQELEQEFEQLVASTPVPSPPTGQVEDQPSYEALVELLKEHLIYESALVIHGSAGQIILSQRRNLHQLGNQLIYLTNDWYKHPEEVAKYLESPVQITADKNLNYLQHLHQMSVDEWLEEKLGKLNGYEKRLQLARDSFLEGQAFLESLPIKLNQAAQQSLSSINPQNLAFMNEYQLDFLRKEFATEIAYLNSHRSGWSSSLSHNSTERFKSDELDIPKLIRADDARSPSVVVLLTGFLSGQYTRIARAIKEQLLRPAVVKVRGEVEKGFQPEMIDREDSIKAFLSYPKFIVKDKLLAKQVDRALKSGFEKAKAEGITYGGLGVKEQLDNFMTYKAMDEGVKGQTTEEVATYLMKRLNLVEQGHDLIAKTAVEKIFTRGIIEDLMSKGATEEFRALANIYRAGTGELLISPGPKSGMTVGAIREMFLRAEPKKNPSSSAFQDSEWVKQQQTEIDAFNQAKANIDELVAGIEAKQFVANYANMSQFRYKKIGAIGPKQVIRKAAEVEKQNHLLKSVPFQGWVKLLLEEDADELASHVKSSAVLNLNPARQYFYGRAAKELDKILNKHQDEWELYHYVGFALGAHFKVKHPDHLNQLLFTTSGALAKTSGNVGRKEISEYLLDLVGEDSGSLDGTLPQALKFCKFAHSHGGDLDKTFMLKLARNPNFARYDSGNAVINNLFEAAAKLRQLGGYNGIVKNAPNVVHALQRQRIIRPGLKTRLIAFSKLVLDNTTLHPDVPGYEERRALVSEVKADLKAIEMNESLMELLKESEPKDPHIYLLNWDPGNGKYRFRVLKENDPYHLQVGIDTNCCQQLGGAGEDAAKDSFVNPLASVVLLEFLDPKEGWVTAGQSYFHWVPNDNGYILDNIEASSWLEQCQAVTGYTPEMLYAIWAQHVSRQAKPKYLLVGAQYTKIDEKQFKPKGLKGDPRDFVYEYSDWSPDSSHDLLAPTFELPEPKKEAFYATIAQLNKLGWSEEARIVRAAGALIW